MSSATSTGACMTLSDPQGGEVGQVGVVQAVGLDLGPKAVAVPDVEIVLQAEHVHVCGRPGSFAEGWGKPDRVPFDMLRQRLRRRRGRSA